MAAFSSASRAARSLLSFRLLALLGLKGAFVCPSRRCDIGCRYVRGVQGCKVGSFQPPDELAGICTGWITRQRESIIQKRERKHCACGPRVPFPIQGTIFPKCGGLEKRISLGGARVGQWGVGVMLYMYMWFLSPFLHSGSLLIRSRSENAECYYGAVRAHKRHFYDGWVWDLERPPV